MSTRGGMPNQGTTGEPVTMSELDSGSFSARRFAIDSVRRR
jgi:hypothetical protein